MLASEKRSETIGRKLKQYIPGGAHTYSKGDDQWPAITPSCIERGLGSYVWDADGNKFIDWSMGLTSVCLGHANAEINQAAIDAMALGHNFQRPSVMEAEAAEHFLHFLKDRGEMVKFTKNGSTATTAAVKLARAFTGRNRVAICADHPFFSYDDWFIGATKSPSGVPDPIRALTVNKFTYNDLRSVEQMFARHPQEIACIILEPVKFSPPRDNFLQKLQALCHKEGALLILDEMVTGFKWHPRGAGAYYGAEADMYTWGKGMANGHSVCALTGKREILELGGLDHDQPRVFLASTTHGAEIPQLAAMRRTLDIFTKNPQLLDDNWTKGKKLRQELNSLVSQSSLESELEFIGEDCFFAVNVKAGGIHPLNVARTYLLQELVRENQLFQGLFYVSQTHDKEIMEATLTAWQKALPRFKQFITSGKRSELIGPPTRPVFRAFNKCECLSAEQCQACMTKLQLGQ